MKSMSCLLKLLQTSVVVLQTFLRGRAATETERISVVMINVSTANDGALALLGWLASLNSQTPIKIQLTGKTKPIRSKCHNILLCNMDIRETFVQLQCLLIHYLLIVSITANYSKPGPAALFSISLSLAVI